MKSLTDPQSSTYSATPPPSILSALHTASNCASSSSSSLTVPSSSSSSSASANVAFDSAFDMTAEEWDDIERHALIESAINKRIAEFKRCWIEYGCASSMLLSM